MRMNYTRMMRKYGVLLSLILIQNRAKNRKWQHDVLSSTSQMDFPNRGGVNQQVTMLFADIRGFTSLSETLEPDRLIRLLNKYFSETVPIIFKHNGMLDKFIGDATMALFGVPESHDECALDAVAAAIEVQQRMSTLNIELRAMGLPEIGVGIGINTGVVTVGCVGAATRWDYSVIGDAVNLAARLEKQAESGQILISESTLGALGGAFPVRPLEARVIKGKRDPVMLYEVLWELCCVVPDLEISELSAAWCP